MRLVKMKKLKLNNNALPVIGMLSRNGHGSMTLGMDSRGHENIVHYDSNVESDALHKKWKEHQLCWVKTIWSSCGPNDARKFIFAGLLRRLTEQVITPLTIKSSTPEWFIMCMFSFTSYTSNRVLNTILKLNHDHLSV